METKLSRLIAHRMAERGISIKDLATSVGMVYEHARRIVRGQGIPSKRLLQSIAEVLDMPYP